MQKVMRIDELEGIIARILGLGAQYEVRLIHGRGPLNWVFNPDVRGDRRVRWRDLDFEKIKTVRQLRTTMRKRYGFQCRVLDCSNNSIPEKTKLEDLRPQEDQPLGWWQRIVNRARGQ